MKKMTTYKKPEVELVPLATLQPLAQSVSEPGGKGYDFEWGTFNS